MGGAGIGDLSLKELLEEVGKDPADVRKRASEEFAKGMIPKERLETLSCVVMLHGPIDRELREFFKKLKGECAKGQDSTLVFREIEDTSNLLAEVVVPEGYLEDVEDGAKKLLHLYLGKGQVSGRDRKAIALALVFLGDFAKEDLFTQRFVCYHGGKSETSVRGRSKEILHRLGLYQNERPGDYDLSRPKDVAAAKELLRALLARHDELVKEPCVSGEHAH